MSADRPTRRTILKRKARSVLIWGAAAFVMGQCALFAGLEGRLAHWRDPESAIKLTRLRERLRERSGAGDLVLALGTSRVGMGVRPDCIREELARNLTSAPPLVFNYAVNNGGPLLDLVYLRRALRAGMRPRVVLVELWPVSLRLAGAVAVEGDREVYLHRSGVADIEEVSRQSARPLDFLSEWVGNQLTLCHSQRSTILAMGARMWLPRDTEVDTRWRGIDAWGFQYLPGYGTHDAERYRSSLPRWQAAFGGYYTAFRVSPAAASSLRQILETCRAENIRPILLRMPESPSFGRGRRRTSTRRWTSSWPA